MSTAKKIAKAVLSATLGKDSSAVDRVQCRNYDLVCFDVFDTLIVRNCSSPETLFSFVQRVVEKHLGEGAPSDFSRKRIVSERKARANAHGEVTLAEIYAEFPDVAEKDRLHFAEIEMEAERKVCRANLELLTFFKRATSSVPTAIISDMYLPAECIATILKDNGLAGYDRLYVSSESKRTKRSGDLFDLVLSDFGVAPDRAFHIGDHPLSDYLVPKRRGLNAFLFRKRDRNG